jgi:hypothetical protein
VPRASVASYNRGVYCIALTGTEPTAIYSVVGYDFSVIVVPRRLGAAELADSRAAIERLHLHVTTTNC